MKTILSAVALCLLSLTANAQQPVNPNPIPSDIGKRLADQVPRPISVPSPEPTPSSVREQVFRRLATWQGLVVATAAFALTIFICRPRKTSVVAQQPLGQLGKPRTLVEEFRASMGMNQDDWHETTSYDLYLIDKATPDERAQIEKLLLDEPVTDWRIVEGLSRLRTPATIAKLHHAFATTRYHDVSMAISEYAADFITVEQRSTAIIAAVREAPLTKGLHLALLQLTTFHPPEIIDELLRATVQREGDAAMHCAAHLLVLHGKATKTFEDEHRAFLNRFATQVPHERLAAHEELLRMIGR